MPSAKLRASLSPSHNSPPVAVAKYTKTHTLQSNLDVPEAGSTKERILQAAEGLFAKKGFGATRTRDIADQVNINVSTLHFHWKSKEELYTAVYRRLLAQRAQLAEDVFALLTQTATTPDCWQETVQAVVDKTFTFFRTHVYAARLDTHRLLDATTLGADLEQGPGGTLLMSVAARLRELMRGDLARRLDVELTILSVNAFVREYFTNPAALGRLLGEQKPAALERRVKRHVQQMMARLYELR